MEKIYVIYWSMSGNTQAMAEAIAKGINDSGKEAVVQYVSEASVSELQDAKVFALGCPAMGAEVLEEGEMEPFCKRSRRNCGRQKDCSFRFIRMGRRTVDERLGRKNERMRCGNHKRCRFNLS